MCITRFLRRYIKYSLFAYNLKAILYCNNINSNLLLFNFSSAVVKTTSSPLSLQKSQSFCSDKANKLMNNATISQNSSNTTEVTTKTITATDILNARSALKPSRSCPHELNDNDNSSSGVSSDQESKQNSTQPTQTTKFVTYLPIESSTPIVKKSYDSDSESSFESHENMVHMKKMLHPKLQAIFNDMPAGGSYSSQTLPNRYLLYFLYCFQMFTFYVVFCFIRSRFGNFIESFLWWMDG